MKKQFIDDELKMLHSDIEECKKKWEKIYECAAHGLTVRSPEYRAIEKAFLYIREALSSIKVLSDFRGIK